MVELIVASSATALATGLGAIPVFALSEPSRAARGAMLGAAAGVMAVAAVSGLLIPGLREGRNLLLLAGLLVGIAFVLGVRSRLSHSKRISGHAGQTSALVFLVLLVHSLPEGFAIGTAYASSTAGLGLFVVIAIGIQNIPEGTSVALPMAAAGASPSRQFWAAVVSSLPQPVGAVLAYGAVQEVNSLLPVSFGFAAGAMAAVVVVQMVPDSIELDRGAGVRGIAAGLLLMLVLSAALGIFGAHP